MSTKSAQKQVFLLILRVKICRYALGTKNKNVRHVEKNKISKNKKIVRANFEKNTKEHKNQVFLHLYRCKKQKFKNQALYVFSHCHKESIKKKL